MTIIVPLSSRHCDSVAQLHLNHLRSSFKGMAGQRLLRAYYAAVAEGVGACGYVAEDDGLVVGYVCGVWGPSMVRAGLVKKHWFKLMFWGIAQLFNDPALITSLIGRMREPLNRPDVAEIGYELRPIVVAPPVRGTGLASELVATLLADAGRRGFQCVHLFTQKDDVAANAFYRKMGFRSTGVVYRSAMSYVRYERPVFEAV